MKTIKFRAWDEGNKVMHYDFKWISSGYEGDDWIIFTSDKYPLENNKTNPLTNPNPYFAQQFKIMQDTGLLDKNNKEIYEGDIVKGTEDNEYQGQSNVFWSNSWNLEPFSYLGCRDMNKFEVIGNIYENPKLYKEKD